MNFKDKFPELIAELGGEYLYLINDRQYDGTEHLTQGEKPEFADYITFSAVEEFCLSKQRVKDAVEKHLMCMSHGVKRWCVDEVELLLKDLEIENVLESKLGFSTDLFIPVVSSNIKSYAKGYVETVANSGKYIHQLYIEFLNGSVYRYDTTLETINLFELADSKGKFHNEYIKGKFEYTKIKDADKKEEST